MALRKPDGIWTYDDLLTFPEDDRRYEIIEGELYEMPSPNLWHAATIMNLIRLLLPIIDGLRGQLYTASLDVFFPGADPVIPDLLVILPHSQSVTKKRGVEGPPDLVIEVVSPSNRVHDLLTKRALYGRAGVREYWIVDPAARSVEILTLREDALHTTQAVAGNDTITSPLLDASMPLDAIFANVGDEAEN